MTDVIETRAAATEVGRVRTWVRVCRWGAATVGVWAVLVTAVAREVIPPVVVLGIVFGGLAIALARGRRRLALATAVLGVLGIAGNLPATIDELRHPSSGVAFVLTLLLVLGVVLMVVGGIAAFAGRTTRAVRPLAAGAAAVLAVGAAVATVASLTVDSTGPREGDVEVVAELTEYDVDRLTVTAGATGFWLDNRDGIRHTLTLEGTDTGVDAPGYSSQRADLDLSPGEYALVCGVPGHERMRIDLVVTP